MAITDDQDPHAEDRVVLAGAPLAEARSAIIALHGRGADAADIIGLAQEVAPASMAILAPESFNNTWYPYRFIEPIARNEPYLSSALRLIGRVIQNLGEAGIPAERVALLGFSQGACLTAEFAARHAQRYGALLVFSGGLIGPPGTVFAYPGGLDGTPVFLGCSDVDAHIPEERVRESASVLSQLGGNVDLRIYPGMGHTINRDELDVAKSLLSNLEAQC